MKKVKEKPRSSMALTLEQARKLKEDCLEVMDGCTQGSWRDAYASIAAGAMALENLWHSAKARKEKKT